MWSSVLPNRHAMKHFKGLKSTVRDRRYWSCRILNLAQEWWLCSIISDENPLLLGLPILNP